jgi:hypothetical protein
VSAIDCGPIVSAPAARAFPLRKLAAGIVALGGTGACILLVLKLAATPWPFAHAEPRLVGVAAALLALSLFMRVAGWQRLFARSERPDRQACLASASVAAISSAVVPLKLDYALKIWLLRRMSRNVALEAGVVSLCTLGLVDAAVLFFPAVTGAITSPAPAIRASLLVLCAVAAICGGLLISASRMERLPLLRRSRRLRGAAARIARRVCDVRENLVAFLLLSASLWIRAGALGMLLASLGVGFSIAAALVYICLTAGSAFVPIPSFGMGAGTVALGAAGMSLAHAAQFALALSLLSMIASAAIALAVGALIGGRRLSRSLTA